MMEQLKKSGKYSLTIRYDEFGRLAEAQTGSESAIYYYDEVGNRDCMELDLDGTAGYEIKTDYTYNQMNRLTNLVQQKTGGAGLAAYNYTLKANGNRHSLNETLNESRDITYGYDNLNRLTSETADSSGNGYSATYQYDLAGNRTLREVTANNQLLTTDYTYYAGTDKLYTETHAGPVYAVNLGEDDRFYAYAAPNGGYFYRDTHGNKIGTVHAFLLGLPSVWSRYLFIFAMAMAPVLLFGPALLRLAKRYVLRQPIRVRLRVPRKGICLLTAFVMLFGPENFQNLAQAEIQYANISTASWANGDTIITYTYDDNGSVTSKTTTTGSVVKEVVTYQYNLAGRLDKVTTDEQTGTKNVVEYIYNDEGIRVRAYSYDQPTGGGTKSNEKTVTYLIDSYNHTGYAQTLEELTFNRANPNPLTDTPDSLRTYLIGDDVIAQTVDGETQYLLYDGHGSTRQMTDNSGQITDSFSYDGYGVLLQDETAASARPGYTPTQATSLLYAGEYFDTDLQQYYLRARYYNPLNGLFNRMDPFSGSPQDPQSLHKYLYCHANPVNAIDPSGTFSFSIAGLSTAMSIGIVIAAIVTTTIVGLDVFIERGPDPWTLLREPLVNAELRKAYIDSHVGTINATEQGGTIIRTPQKIFRVIRWPAGAAASVRPLQFPSGRIGNDKIVGSFHTHPNVGLGWRQEPSDADLRWFGANPPSAGNVHFVLSRDKIYVIVRSLILGRVKWRDFAPSQGNIRQERIGVFDEI